MHTSIDSPDRASGKSERIEFLGINYIGMIPLLTKGMQEQQELIEAQKTELSEQAEEINDLSERLVKLEKIMSKLVD